MKHTKFLLALTLIVSMLFSSANALTLDTAESFDAEEAANHAALAAELDIPMYDASYGELVWYNNFESSLTEPVFCAGTSGSGSIDAVYGTGEVTDSPTGNGKALLMKCSGNSNSGYVVKMSGYDKTGLTVTLVADYYLPSDSTVNAGVWYRFSGFDGKWGLLGTSADKDTWKTVSHSAATSSKLTNCEFRNDAGAGGIYYLDNVRVYVKYALDASTIRLVDGNDVQTVTIGDTYTFPKASNESAYYTVWVDDSGKRYAADEAVNASDIGGKTFTALVTDIPLLDEENGILAIYHGFEGANHTQIEYFSKEVFENVQFSAGNGIGFNTFAQVKDSTDSSNKVLEMTLKDGASWTISGFQYTLDNSAFVLKEGTYSEFMDIYNRNEGSYLKRNSLYNGDLDGDNSFGAWNRMQDIEFIPYTWVKNVAFDPMTAAVNKDESTAESAKYVLSWGTDGHQQRNMNQLKYIQHRFVDSGKTSVTVDNYRLYFYPANAFMVKDGDALVMERGQEDGTYTFKAPSEVLGGEYGANVCYTDGTNKYFAGQTVDIANIAGKTLTLEEVAPVNSGNAEIRVNNSAKTTGIRFKASITPSLKAVSNEYGFIVAREDVLENLGAELTFGLSKEGIPNGEGILFVRGVAYKTNENGEAVIDKVYSDNDDGSMNYTCVGVGFDITVKLQVTTKMTARPYVIIKNADGSEFVAYGESYSESLAGVAEALKNAADSGDTNAVDAYNSANYEGGNFIDDILATANN